MHEGIDESLRKICKYQQNVPHHDYLFDTLVGIPILSKKKDGGCTFYQCEVQGKPHLFAAFVHVLSKLCTLGLKVLERFCTFPR